MLKIKNVPFKNVKNLQKIFYSRYKKIIMKRTEGEPKPPKENKYKREELPRIKLPKLPDLNDMVQNSSQCVGCGSILQLKDPNKEGKIIIIKKRICFTRNV
jgi:hypothetical protein